MSNLISSARNQLTGVVTQIIEGAVNSEITLDIGGTKIIAIITNQSVKELGLKIGSPAMALIKSSWVILCKEQSVKTSARNQLVGKITSCQLGAVNGEVIMELPTGQNLAAIITNESLKGLGLKEGDEVCALIKASQVVIAVS